MVLLATATLIPTGCTGTAQPCSSTAAPMSWQVSLSISAGPGTGTSARPGGATVRISSGGPGAPASADLFSLGNADSSQANQGSFVAAPSSSSGGSSGSSSGSSSGGSSAGTDLGFLSGTGSSGASSGESSSGGSSSGTQGTVDAFGGKALNVPLINQNTGGGRYPGAYCGPTSVRMVLAYFGTKIDADTAASGVYTRGQGASHEGMAKKLRQYGVKADMSSSRSLSALQAAVGRGHPVIVNVRGNYGPRSTGGHIIVVVGFDGSGNPIINDPAGGGRHVCPKRLFVNAWNGLMIEASK